MRKLSMQFVVSVAAFTILSSVAGQTSPTATADALFKSGDFDAAGRGYEATLKVSPKDAAALAGEARVRGLENKNDQAMALAQQALAIDPANKTAQMALTFAKEYEAALLGTDYHFEGRPASETIIPFVATDPLPIVQVTIDGRQAYFFIDTGGTGFGLSADFAKELGLQTRPLREGVFAGGKRAEVYGATVPELKIGALTLKDTPVTVLDQGLEIGRAFKTQGVIGTSFLMQFLPTLDYCQGRLLLRQRGASARLEGMAARSRANIVPMWLDGDHFIFAKGRMGNGAEHLYFIDTGMAGGGLGATKATLNEAGVAIDPSAARIGVGGGGAVSVIPFQASATLGGMTVDDVHGMYNPTGNAYGIFPFEVAGTLSHMFFRHSRLTFDFDAMRLITESC